MTVAVLGAAEGAGAAGAAGAAGGAEAAAGGRAASGAAASTAKGAKGAKGGKGGRASDVASGVGIGDMISGKRLPKVGKGSNARRALVAEFALCMVVLAFSPLTGKAPSASAFMKRASAIMGLFFLLGLLATAGRGASRAAAGFGGLVTLVLLISERSVFTVLAAKLQPGVGETDDPGGLDAQNDKDLEDIGHDVGEIIGDVGEHLNEITPLPPLGPLGNGIR
jgi:hypothetical protein